MSAKSKTTTSSSGNNSMICKGGCSGKPKAISNFYKSNLEEYKVYGGYCPTCKVCLSKSTIDINANTVTMESIKSALKKVDKPFIEEVFAKIVKLKPSNDKFLGLYIKQLNLEHRYKNMVYADSIDIQIEHEKIMNSRVDEVKKDEVTDEMRLFWGKNLSNEDYIDLQARFDRFMENEDSDDLEYKKELDYKKLCIWEFQLSKIQYDIGMLKEATQLGKNIADLSNDLGIKAIQKKEDKNNNKHYIAGLIIKFIENVKKEPILKPEDYMKNYSKAEFEEELRLNFTAPLMDSFEMNNPFKEEWENDKKKYEPTKEEVEAFSNSKDGDE